jgi:hypothetical protein
MVGTSNHSETDMAMAMARLKEQAFDGRGSPNSSAISPFPHQQQHI